MKDYERQVIWLDYFNSSYSRSQGRRVSRNRSIKNPILSDLLEAAKRLNLNPTSHEVVHPKHTSINSGYISDYWPICKLIKNGKLPRESRTRRPVD